tara:strand:+ start:589 stop:2694 length:2106 start_codon:yes stop_codon:yes gene_type:complete
MATPTKSNGAAIEMRLDDDGQTVTMKLAGFLGRDRFPLYREVCASNGARFVPSERANRAPINAVPGLLDGFTSAKLEVALDEQIALALTDAANDAVKLADSGKQALTAASAMLAERGLKLRRYQETGLQWLAPRHGALLTDEMGLGKTVQALMALPADAAAMVVLPAAVRYNWASEVKRWRPDLTPVSLSGKGQFRWPSKGEVMITTWDSIPGDIAADGSVTLDMPMAPAGMFLIGDEAHNVKNYKAQRTKRFTAVVDFVRASNGFVWLLTGTPLMNHPPELWQLLKLTGTADTAFGGWHEFKRMFNASSSRYGLDWGKPSAEVPDRLRRVMLHRRRAEVAPDLPPKTRSELVVNNLSAATVALCDEAVEAMKARGLDLSAIDNLSDAGIPFEMQSRLRAALAAAKTPAMIKLVETYEEEGTPVVVASDYRTPVDALADRPGWATITGSTSADERGRIVEEFQAGKLKGIAGTFGAMGVGVTLTHAHHMIMVDLPWTPAAVSQMEDRICRIGQAAENVFITRMIASHPLDARVVELLTMKQEIIENSIEAAGVEQNHLPEAPGAKLTEAAAMASKMAADLKAAEALREAQKQQAKREREAQTLADLGTAHDGREVRVDGSRRSAANALEDWAAAGIVRVAELDPDHARDENGVGFSAFDGKFGHSLADQFLTTGLLSSKQWAACVKLARKYRGQIGQEPTA